MSMNIYENSLLTLIRDICENGKADLFESDWLKIGLDYIDTERLSQKLHGKGVVLSIERTFSSSKFKSAGEAKFVRYGTMEYDLPAFSLSIDEKRLEELLEENKSVNIDEKDSLQFKKLTVSLNDRIIKINEYILSKPHAVGANMKFFEAVYAKPNIEINIDELPNIQKEDFEWKKTSKLLNSLGFSGEIMKAFFPKRTDKKPRIKFLKSVSREDLEKRGIKINLLIKELERAHLKNSPE